MGTFSRTGDRSQSATCTWCVPRVADILSQMALAAVVVAIEEALGRRNIVDQRGVIVERSEFLVADRCLELFRLETLQGSIRGIQSPEGQIDRGAAAMATKIEAQDGVAFLL